MLHRSEKPCQACTASIEDLQSQYLQAWGNLAPWAKIYITKTLLSRGTHTSEISNTYCTVDRITIYEDIAFPGRANAVAHFISMLYNHYQKTTENVGLLCIDLIGIVDFLLIPSPLITVTLVTVDFSGF